MAISSARVRSLPMARAVNALVTSLRNRVWSGASTVSIDGGSIGPMGPGPAKRSSARSAGGVGPLGPPTTPKSWLRSTAVQTSWSWASSTIPLGTSRPCARMAS